MNYLANGGGVAVWNRLSRTNELRLHIIRRKIPISVKTILCRSDHFERVGRRRQRQRNCPPAICTCSCKANNVWETAGSLSNRQPLRQPIRNSPQLLMPCTVSVKVPPQTPTKRHRPQHMAQTDTKASPTAKRQNALYQSQTKINGSDGSVIPKGPSEYFLP